jgi:hypothetical protein
MNAVFQKPFIRAGGLCKNYCFHRHQNSWKNWFLQLLYLQENLIQPKTYCVSVPDERVSCPSASCDAKSGFDSIFPTEMFARLFSR